MGNVQHTALIEVNCKCIHIHVRGCIYCHPLNSTCSPLDLYVEGTHHNEGAPCGHMHGGINNDQSNDAQPCMP